MTIEPYYCSRLSCFTVVVFRCHFLLQVCHFLLQCHLLLSAVLFGCYFLLPSCHFLLQCHFLLPRVIFCSRQRRVPTFSTSQIKTQLACCVLENLCRLCLGFGHLCRKPRPAGFRVESSLRHFLHLEHFLHLQICTDCVWVFAIYVGNHGPLDFVWNFFAPASEIFCAGFGHLCRKPRPV